jgi:hypothetical protein
MAMQAICLIKGSVNPMMCAQCVCFSQLPAALGLKAGILMSGDSLDYQVGGVCTHAVASVDGARNVLRHADRAVQLTPCSLQQVQR